MRTEITRLRSSKLETSGTFPRVRRTQFKVSTNVESKYCQLTETAGLADENEYLLVFDNGKQRQKSTHLKY